MPLTQLSLWLWRPIMGSTWLRLWPVVARCPENKSIASGSEESETVPQLCYKYAPSTGTLLLEAHLHIAV